MEGLRSYRLLGRSLLLLRQPRRRQGFRPKQLCR